MLSFQVHWAEKSGENNVVLYAYCFRFVHKTQSYSTSDGSWVILLGVHTQRGLNFNIRIMEIGSGVEAELTLRSVQKEDLSKFIYLKRCPVSPALLRI